LKIGAKRGIFLDMNDAKILILEEEAKAGREVPPGQQYRIRVDKENFDLTVDHLTGQQILDLVNKKPKDWKLFEHVRGNQPREIQPEETVFFTKKGLERFSTFAKDTTEGARG
jgi:hypothetical protein